MTDEELKRVIAESTEATRRRFEAVAERIEDRFRVMTDAVKQVRDELGRDGTETRQEMKQGFADTQAMIRFSHAELDRRIGTLEREFAELKARVDRLETTTH
jgi:uncharacterized protein YceH (UPF0502 family)